MKPKMTYNCNSYIDNVCDYDIPETELSVVTNSNINTYMISSQSNTNIQNKAMYVISDPKHNSGTGSLIEISSGIERFINRGRVGHGE